ncbi:3-hydroxyacyl-CoA dehydrogenase NAD-binding domain-containing protein [Salinifilum ghardaiensis]
MSPQNDPQWTEVAVVGAGTIGLSWAALYAARGMAVRLSDPRDDLQQQLDEALPQLAEGLPGIETAQLRERITTTSELSEAVSGVDLVQENGPERLRTKRELFAQLVELAPPGAVLASSSSGLVASDIAAELADPAASRVLIAHPFNPPHVVPLVELVPGSATAESTVAAMQEFYGRIGKAPIRVHGEVPGFVANRLQSSIMREAISLVLDGVVDVGELDAVMKNSLGQRYATVGPFESFHLGGGPGGIRHMMEHLGAGMAEQWEELGRPEMNDAAVAAISEQTENAYGSGPEEHRRRSALRDRKHLALDAALHSAAQR